MPNPFAPNAKRPLGPSLLQMALQPHGLRIAPDFPRPQATISAAKPGVSDKVENKLSAALGGLFGGAGQRLAKRAMAPINDWTPVGNAQGIEDGTGMVRQGINKGNLGLAMLGAGVTGLNILPFAGAAKRRGGNVLADLMRDETGAIKAYHGGTAHAGNFDLSHAGSGLGYADEPAVWFTPDPYEANRYAWSVGGGSGSYNGKAVYPASIDNAGFDELAPSRYDPEEFARIIAEARKANKPGIVFRSVKEDDRLSRPVDQIAVLDPARIRSYFDK